MYKFIKSSSNIKPKIIDLTSSSYGIYYRKNIKEVEREITEGQTVTEFQYDEIYLPNDFRFDIEDIEIYAAKLEEIIENNNNDIKQKRINEILAALDNIDLKSIRALRAGETDRIEELENEAIKLRAEMWDLQK